MRRGGLRATISAYGDALLSIDMIDERPHARAGEFMPNYLRSERESSWLVSLITEYWCEHGYPDVKAWVERIPLGDLKEIYVVRSNLVNGKPK